MIMRNVTMVAVSIFFALGFTSYADAVEVKVTAVKGVKRHLSEGTRIEQFREKEWRGERPVRGSRFTARKITLLRTSATNTDWMNETLFPNVEDLSLVTMAQKILELHVPDQNARLEVDLERISIPNASLAGWRGVNFSIKGTIREVSADGSVIREKTFSSFNPYRNQQTVPSTHPGYVVQQNDIGTPAVTLAAYWALEAVKQFYPEADVPVLWSAKL